MFVCLEQHILYSLDQMLRLLFISPINFVRLLFESGVYLTQRKIFCKFMYKELGVLEYQQ